MRVEKGDIVDSKSFHRLFAPYIRMRAYRVKRKKEVKKRKEGEEKIFKQHKNPAPGQNRRFVSRRG